MNNNVIGLILTLIVGLSFLLGYLIVKTFKNKHRLLNITMGVAATVLIGIILFDLIPEAYELLDKFNYKTLLILGFTLIGFSFLWFLDKKIPHHDDHNNKNDQKHLYHIGVITAISLILHNFIEGSAIYSVSLTDMKAGCLMAIGVILHNIPLGMIIVPSLSEAKKKTKNIFLIFLVLSSFLGGLSLFIMGNNISNTLLGSLISITLGMTIYIVFMELIKEIFEEKAKKDSFLGIIIGLILIILSRIV